MAKRNAAPSDPIFVAEIAHIRARRPKVGSRQGHGKVVDELGQPTELNETWRARLAPWFDVSEHKSVLRPSGDGI